MPHKLQGTVPPCLLIPTDHFCHLLFSASSSDTAAHPMPHRMDYFVFLSGSGWETWPSWSAGGAAPASCLWPPPTRSRCCLPPQGLAWVPLQHAQAQEGDCSLPLPGNCLGLTMLQNGRKQLYIQHLPLSKIQKPDCQMALPHNTATPDPSQTLAT